jgi:segregation and condensation protein B
MANVLRDSPSASKRQEERAEERGRTLRIVEALLFASREPLAPEILASKLPAGTNIMALLEELRLTYAGRGVTLYCTGGRWSFRTAEDLRFLLAEEHEEPKKLSKAAMETLAILAYHQPVTRAEIEEIRGVSTAKGTLDILLETGWVRLRGRRKSPGRPVTYGTTPAFLDHFGLESLTDLPGLEELKNTGFFEGRLPPGLAIPLPDDSDPLTPDEEPLEEQDIL